MHENKRPARPRKSPRTFKLLITAPIEAKPILDAIASYLDTSPESYTLTALFACMRCDAEMVGHESERVITTLEGRAQ